MTSLTLQFNQLVDLAVNPSLGTVNTVLLHNLLHVVVDQLRLSKNFIEFHGAGSAAIETSMVNFEQHCGLTISEYEVKKEVDEATGIQIEKRILIPNESDQNVKVFAIKNVGANTKCPAGFPLNPMQVLSVDEFQIPQTSSIHDVIARVLPDNKLLITENQRESSLKAMFDFINLSKRVDALEIGIRQLADIIRKSQCEVDDKSEAIEVIEPELQMLRDRVNNIEDKVNSLECKCTEENFEENLFNAFQVRMQQILEESMESVQSGFEEFRNIHRNALDKFHEETRSFKEMVCERLETYKNDYVKCMIEIQAMMDAKLDKFFVPELKNYLKEMIQSLENKIDKLDFNKALAAGASKRIFKDLNCVSCGENVIQADARNQAQSTKKDYNRQSCIDGLQPTRLQTRLCGGKHTVTTPNERVFKSETVKTQCH